MEQQDLDPLNWRRVAIGIIVGVPALVIGAAALWLAWRVSPYAIILGYYALWGSAAMFALFVIVFAVRLFWEIAGEMLGK